MPRVSVVTPSYNRKEFLWEAIDSVRAQTYRDFEIIVVDDGSTDGTAEQLTERYGKEVRLLSLPHTGLPASGRNAGIQAAGGEFVAFLDSDDLWRPQKLERQIAAAERDPKAVLYYALAKKFGASESQGVTMRFHYRPSGRVFNFLIFYNFIPTLTTLVRRDVFERVGFFDTRPDLRAAEDYDMWLRIARLHRVRYVPEVLAEYRLHPENISSNIFAGYDRIERVLQKTFGHNGTPKFLQRKALSHNEMGRFEFGLLLCDRREEVLAHLQRAVRIDPLCLTGWAGLLLMRCVQFSRLKRVATHCIRAVL
ncbi:MAG: hypothetical protein A2992_09890 [Elusimicrobia bacterium RIFCSPLOWO2_01_FULL_59_12]|nr:MAG: hypothetical protein A2992_09890 [Elusimicrobia bacterium RIFCSPLOWO2_01_FULL_59_12]